jgi:uncharacterized membrane protein YhhN
MIAGVVLGPSLFGLLWPGIQQQIFPAETMPALFSIMVLMAIVTTLMATPLFELVYGRYMKKTRQQKPVLEVREAN